MNRDESVPYEANVSAHRGEVVSTLGKRVRFYRTRLGLSQHALADRAGISQARVSQIEWSQGNKTLPRRTLTILAAALEVTVADLIGDDSVEHESQVEDLRHDNVAVLPPPGPLIGREEDLASLRHQILEGKTRLITLTGPGGV